MGTNRFYPEEVKREVIRGFYLSAARDEETASSVSTASFPERSEQTKNVPAAEDEP
jgi:hypothetical protein